MAIQPIDLQGMYNQMHSVAQSVAHHQQGVKLAESMQQHNVVQQNMEAAERVQKASNDNSQASLVKDNGGGSGAAMYQGKRRSSHSQEEDQDVPENNNSIKESYIGRIIDITR